MFEEDLDRAIVLIKSGKGIEARKILEQIVQDDPKNESAWIWLADTYPDNPNRIAVLQECLKYNPNSHVIQRWLAATGTEELNLPKTVNQKLPNFKGKQVEPIQENGGKSSGSSNYSDRFRIRQKAKNARVYVALISLFGFVLLGSMGVFGITVLQKQGIFTDRLKSKPISNLPTVSQVPSPTIAVPVIPINETPTLTFFPTRTQTLSITFTPTITLTPSITSTIPSISATASATETFTPMSEVAAQAKGVAINRGFRPDSNACGQYRSCQAYLSEAPYMLMVIMNNGMVRMTLDGETYSGQYYLQTPGAAAPNNIELLWYKNVIGDIYNSFSADFWKDTAVVLDRTLKYGSYDWESYYGYKISGSQSTPHETILTITPP